MWEQNWPMSTNQHAPQLIDMCDAPQLIDMCDAPQLIDMCHTNRQSWSKERAPQSNK